MLKIHGCLFLNLCTYITFLECAHNTGVCKRNIHNQVENICCDNFEPRSDDKNKCQECPPGSTAVRGLPCTGCKDNTYGSKCSFNCNCMRTEICDSVIGCLTKYQTQSGVITYTGQDNFEQTTRGNTGGGTREMIYIYVMIACMIVITIGICVLCHKRATAILYRLNIKRKPTTQSTYQLQVVDIENAQRDESSYDVIDEQRDKNESNLYDYEW